MAGRLFGCLERRAAALEKRLQKLGDDLSRLSLEITETAEGVELKEKPAFLDDAGCDHVQGFLFS